MEFELQSPELEINTSNKDFDITETQEDITLEIDNSEMSFQFEHNEPSFETPQIGFDYNTSSNKPSINGVELVGDRTAEDLGLQPKGDYANKDEIPIKTSQLENDSNFITSIPSDYVTFEELDSELGNYAKTNDIPDVSEFITRDVRDLDYFYNVYEINEILEETIGDIETLLGGI